CARQVKDALDFW
nr:immunoglobulin heavy chain junction region [Macaca mulatta]